MKFSITIGAFLLGLTSASPVPETVLPRAGGEGLHLANCINNGVGRSYILYYPNDANSNSNPPDPNSGVAPTGQSGSYVKWEGQSITGRFGNGVSATSSIGAGTHATYSFSGTARNSFGQNFNCYQDNGHQLFNVNGFSCNSIYYCLDA